VGEVILEVQDEVLVERECPCRCGWGCGCWGMSVSVEEDRSDCFPLPLELGRELPPDEDMHEPISVLLLDDVADVGVV